MFGGSSRSDSPIEIVVTRERLRLLEILPWLLIVGWYVQDQFGLVPGYLVLGSQILITIMFALSLDLVLGYAGIITLGHAAFFGIGAYAAGIFAIRVTGEPFSGLLVATTVSALAGFLSGLVILRTRGLTLLMLTLAIMFLLLEGANKAHFLTGGTDGLWNVDIAPLFGVFDFDFFGRTSYIYSAITLFIVWLFVRRLIASPFGRSLVGIRENIDRMSAVGAPVRRRLVTVYTIAAALAGLSGALLTQTTEFVSLGVLGLERSGNILIMLVLGGAGRIYGAFVGATVFMIAQDRLAAIDPAYWNLWLGLLLVAIVMFARGGILGLIDRVLALVRRRT